MSDAEMEPRAGAIEAGAVWLCRGAKHSATRRKIRLQRVHSVACGQSASFPRDRVARFEVTSSVPKNGPVYFRCGVFDIRPVTTALHML